MSDNVFVHPAQEANRVSVATDEIDDGLGNKTHYPIYKTAFGTADSVTQVDLSNPLPVTASSLPLPADAATQTTLAAVLAELALKADLTEIQPVSASWANPVFTPDFLIEVQKGNIAGHSIVHKYGRNGAVPNGSWAFVGVLGAVNHLSTPTTVRIKAGGNAADVAGGAGCREITVQGIDSTLAEISETIVTAGASASSATTASFWRVHRVKDPIVGTYGAANTGDIVIENSGGGTDLVMVAADEGQSQYAGFTIPTGKTGYIQTITITVNASKPANIRMFYRSNITDTTAPMTGKALKLNLDGIDGVFNFRPASPLSPIPALTDIWFEAYGNGNASAVSVDFEILLVDD